MRKINKIRFINYRKAVSANSFKKWFYIRRYWSGRLIHIGVRHYAIAIDLRGDFFEEMTGQDSGGE